MNSSGMKRGLAVTAVSALALTGLALSPAQAQTVAQGEPAFELYSQVTGQASTRFDGVNQTITLFAGSPSQIGGTPVNAVKFSYMKGATPVEIATVIPVGGVATMQWTPPSGAERNLITAVRAEALSNANAVLDSQDNPVTGANFATNEAYNLAGALRSEVGISPDGTMVIKGTTTAANVFVQSFGPVGLGPNATAAMGDPDTNNIRKFTAAVPVGGNNTGDAVDEVIVGAGQFGNSEDVNAYSAYEQSVTAVSVSPASAEVQQGGADDDSKYVISATDQKGAPVHGLDVYESDATGAPTDGNGRDADGNAAAAGETGTDGKYTAVLRESDIDNGTDQDNASGVQATHYVVDVNQDGNYDNGVDYRFKISQSRYAPVATTVEMASSKGAALDDDETTNLEVLVKDQKGNPVANDEVVISGTFVRKDTNPEQTIPFGPQAVTTGPNGKAEFPGVSSLNDEHVVLTLNAFANNNGTPQPDAGDAQATPIKVVWNTSHIEWDNGSVAQAGKGSTTVQRGKFVQDDTGTVLPGRTVAVDYNPADNSVLAPQAQQPAGTTRGSDTTASAVTDAAGKFAVAVTDPAVPNGQELNSLLNAQVPTAESGGDQTDETLELDFLRSLTPTRLKVINPATGGEQDGLIGITGSLLTPGALGIGWVEAYNADGDQLTDVVVNLGIDEGHFVDVDLVNGVLPFENATPGAPLDFEAAGKTMSVTTDDSGRGIFVANIERHQGFDDDGQVDDKIDATAGTVSDEHDLTWSTNGTPLNPGSFEVSLSEDQESSILPKARAGNGDSAQVVDYDVVTTDQFGNRTSQPLTTTDNTPVADFNGGFSSEFGLSQPAIRAFSPAAANQALEVELDGARKLIYTDDVQNSEFDPLNPGVNFDFDPVQAQENTSAINWYTVNIAASSFELDQQGSERVPVGSTVSYTLSATDQEGQPLDGFGVGFLRVGPGDQGSDDDGQQGDVTNEDGEAFYDFAGSVPGQANVSAVVYDDRANGNYKRLFVVGPDTVEFTKAVNAIKPELSGENMRGKDVLTVAAPEAHGAQVKLYRKTSKGRELLRTGNLDVNGLKSFTVRDANGKAKSTYVAVVSATPRTQKGKTNLHTMK